MAEEKVLEQEQKTDTADVSTILQSAAFGDNASSQQKAEVKENASENKAETTPTQEEVKVPLEWLKKEFDIEDVSILKAEREELKSAKEKLKKFEVDDNGFKVLDYLKSENEDKLYEFLNTKKKIEKLTSGDVSETNAADIVKFQMQQKYNTLSEEDINYKFNRQFGLPKEPVQGDLEDETEFEQRHNEWKEKSNEIKRELLIEAKLAVPEIQKLKTELILPTIERENQGKKEQTPEEQVAFDNAKNSFLQTFQNVSKDFTGFTAQVKNKDVDYSVVYSPSTEERSLINERMQQFAESGFDANSLLADRWVNKDLTLNVQQMTEDLSRIFMGKNSDAKIANEAANKRLELYLKDKKQIDLSANNEEGKLTLDKGNETVEDKLRERMLQLT